MIPGRDDADNFRKLTTAMDVLAFSREEQDTIQKILASVLHIGNVYFKSVQVRKHGHVRLCRPEDDNNIDKTAGNECLWISHAPPLPPPPPPNKMQLMPLNSLIKIKILLIKKL